MKSRADTSEVRVATAPTSHRPTACPRCHGGGYERVWVSAGYERIVTCTGPAHALDAAAGDETRAAKPVGGRKGRGRKGRRR